MDDKIYIDELKNKVKNFCEERDWDQFHNPKDLAIMIVTEASELLEIFRYKDAHDISNIMNGEKRISVEEEVADVLFGLLRFAQMNNIDLTNALEDKIQKNNKKYPTELVRGKNKKYNEY